MLFVPRTFEQILMDMIAHVRANTKLTDFNIGSVIRTLLEAAALEDDEQYHQMVNLLDDFSYNTATGDDLDKRAADFNITRLGAAQATGRIVCTNGALTKDTLQFDASATDGFITLNDSTDFATSGYPYTIRIGEGTPQVEDISVTFNVTSTGVLTVPALLVYDHSVGETVSFVSGSDVTITSGLMVQVPSSGDLLPVIYQTTETATLIAGNYYSSSSAITAVNSGTDGNTGAGKITQFSGSPPFPGASVTNITATNGGRNVELDREFRERIRSKIQTLSKGTPLSLESALKGLEEPTTGQRVVAAKLVEDFITLEHKVYIDDGTGFIPSYVAMGDSTVDGAGLAAPGAISIPVASASSFPSSGWILVGSGPGTATIELLQYSSKNTTATPQTLVLTVPSVTTKAHANLDGVILVDKIGIAEMGQNFFNATQYPIKHGTIRLFDDSAGLGSILERTLDVDYFLNRTNGQIEYYGAGLPAGTEVLGHYSYYTGLMALAQKVLNGDPSDAVTYPGYIAGGVIIYVDTPVIRQIDIVASISVDVGYDETAVRSSVKTTIENFIDGLAIGDNVILSKLVEQSFVVQGVTNVIIKSPLFDIVILENELPRSYDSSGNSLIQVI
jgi:uncharacterized phage protein gp47/JayE